MNIHILFSHHHQLTCITDISSPFPIFVSTCLDIHYFFANMLSSLLSPLFSPVSQRSSRLVSKLSSLTLFVCPTHLIVLSLFDIIVPLIYVIVRSPWSCHLMHAALNSWCGMWRWFNVRWGKKYSWTHRQRRIQGILYDVG